MILGGGPNRIGQGIEFDYCCCHASFALAEMGIESIMVNSNPETVSTDYDTSDLLFFEPLTTEDVLNICDRVAARWRDRPIWRANAPEPGPGVGDNGASRSSERVSTRSKTPRIARSSSALLQRLGPAATSPTASPGPMERGSGECREDRLPGAGAPQFRAGWPRDGNLLRPGAVRAVSSSKRSSSLRRPAGADRPVSSKTPSKSTSMPSSDGERMSIVVGIMEHIEEAGVHSGDSACSIPAVQPARPGSRGDSTKRRTQVGRRELQASWD